MASISYLKSQLNYWNNQVSTLNTKIKKYKKRKTDVEGVVSSLRSVSTNNASDVNSKLRACASKLDSAINYSAKDAQLNSILNGKNDQGLSDNNISSTNSELQRELNDVKRKITEYENELKTAKDKVAEFKSAIAVEEQRELQEKLSNIFSNLGGGGFR